MRRRGRALLADGSECVFDIYEVSVLWDGSLRRIVVDEASTAPLVDMALLHGYDLSVQVRNGGSVTIKALPIRRMRKSPWHEVEIRNGRQFRTR